MSQVTVKGRERMILEILHAAGHQLRTSTIAVQLWGADDHHDPTTASVLVDLKRMRAEHRVEGKRYGDFWFWWLP